MTGQCQIDFYLLGPSAQTSQQLACKLALMAWERGHQIEVVAGSAAAAASLDKMMWDYPEGRFLPHEQANAGDSQAPVRILQGPPGGSADVVINLGSDALPEPGRFKRLLEIVPHAENDRQASRQKFRAYRALGIEPSTHEIN